MCCAGSGCMGCNWSQIMAKHGHGHGQLSMHLHRSPVRSSSCLHSWRYTSLVQKSLYDDFRQLRLWPSRLNHLSLSRRNADEELCALQGDSGFLVARQGGVIFQTTPVQHFWDCPLQFAAHPDYASVSDQLLLMLAPFTLYHAPAPDLSHFNVRNPVHFAMCEGRACSAADMHAQSQAQARGSCRSQAAVEKKRGACGTRSMPCGCSRQDHEHSMPT